MMDGLLLQTVEGLGEPPPAPSACDIWESLEAEKECITREMLSAGQPCHRDLDGMQESQASEEYIREVEWKYRGHLEARLREITEALDRLMGGTYGRCRDCGAEIDKRRLASDPTAACCINCQESTEVEVVYSTL
jgi:RNA polymerase-binding transcription factor DksA